MANTKFKKKKLAFLMTVLGALGFIPSDGKNKDVEKPDKRVAVVFNEKERDAKDDEGRPINPRTFINLPSSSQGIAMKRGTAKQGEDIELASNRGSKRSQGVVIRGGGSKRQRG